MDGLKVVVRKMKGSRQFGVYVKGVLVEGGFFSREAAQSCADDRIDEMFLSGAQEAVNQLARRIAIGKF